MTLLLSPQISVSPNSFSSGGTQVMATVSVLNRPSYHGKPTIAGLTTITPKIVCSRTPTGVIPFHIQVSACETTHDGENPSNAYMDLHYEWDFGDSSGTETFTDHHNGKTVNANSSQQGPEAAYLYRSAGTYTVTLTVKGKDANGDLITRSTTTILNVGQYYIHLGGATGGTYTLTVNGETTAAIAFNAIPLQVVAALHALASLDATNCHTGLMGMIELNGSLAGTSITFTGDFASLTGTVSTPAIRVEQSSATATSVTVSDLSGLTAQYFDSTYDGSNGVANGTESRPYTTWAAIESFLEAGGSRVAWLKRGSSWSMSSRVTWESDTHETIRVLAYGTGADPILTQTTTSSQFQWNLAYGTAGTPNITMGDFVLSGINVIAGAVLTSFYIVASTNGTAGYPYASLSHIVLDGVTWTTTVADPQTAGACQSTTANTPVYGTSQGGTTGSVTLKSSASSTNDLYNNRLISVVIDGTVEYSTVTDYDGTTKVATVSPSFSGTPDSDDTYVIYLPASGKQVSGLHFWNCDLDGADASQVGIIQSTTGLWVSTVGGLITGGTGSLTFDHHIYMHTTGHNLLRYVEFGPGTKNFCVNGNAHAYGGAMQYSLFDGCDFTGTKNAMDMSNTNNTWTNHPDDGYWDDAVVQFSKLHSGGVDASEQNGIIAYNLNEVTIRDCEFWDNIQTHIGFSNTAGYPWQPKFYAYRNRFYQGRIEVRGSQSHYFHDNVMHSTLDASAAASYCMRFFNTSFDEIDSWDADGNVFYNAATANPFYNSAGAASFSFATWQAAGNDAAGSLSDPLWNDPATGVFIDDPTAAIEWPATFTNLEYSLNGTTWLSYVNEDAVSLGAALSQWTVVYFRADTDANVGLRQVVATTDAGSLDVGAETDEATLTGASEYVVLQVAGQYLIMAMLA